MIILCLVEQAALKLQILFSGILSQKKLGTLVYHLAMPFSVVLSFEKGSYSTQAGPSLFALCASSGSFSMRVICNSFHEGEVVVFSAKRLACVQRSQK